MGWLYTKKRGPQWKQGWTELTLGSISAPSRHLLTIFGIVIVLLWFSQEAGYNAHIQHKAINFQLLLVLLPVLFIIFLLAFYSTSGWLNHRFQQSSMHTMQRGVSPWGIALLLVLILVLLSYQSAFHSKWLGPL